MSHSILVARPPAHRALRRPASLAIVPNQTATCVESAQGKIMKLMFRVFRSEGFADLQIEPTAEKAAEFASSIGKERVVSLSQIMDGHVHAIVVWYWSE